MSNFPQYPHQSPNQFPKVDLTRLQIDRTLEKEESMLWKEYVLSNPEWLEAIQKEKASFSDLFKKISASSGRELSLSMQITIAVLLSAVVVEGCAIPKFRTDKNGNPKVLMYDEQWSLEHTNLGEFGYERGDGSWKKDPEFILEAMKVNVLIIIYADDSLKKDPEFMLKAMAISSYAFHHCDDSLKNNKEFMLATIEIEYSNYICEEVSNSLKNDPEFILRLSEINYTSNFVEELLDGKPELRAEVEALRKAEKAEAEAKRLAEKAEAKAEAEAKRLAEKARDKEDRNIFHTDPQYRVLRYPISPDSIQYLKDSGQTIPHKGALNMLETFSSDDKVALIINGDPYDSRHTGNVELSITVLQQKGFKRFLVVTDQDLSKIISAHKDKISLEQYKGSLQGIDTAIKAMVENDMVKSGDLVFLYTTGHGLERGLAMRRAIYSFDFLVEKLAFIKKNRAMILSVSDQCHGGSFSEKIMDNGLTGVAFAANDKKCTGDCRHYTPSFFEAIDNNMDVNKDGISQPKEWHAHGMKGNSGSGDYFQSDFELSLANIDNYLKNDKPVIVHISADGCIGCVAQTKALDKLVGMAGETLGGVYKLNVSNNPEADEILMRFGLDKNKISVPITLFMSQNNKMKAYTSFRGYSFLARTFKEYRKESRKKTSK